jgi:hypothetical protein
MSGFHEVRFPDNVAYGATGGPEFATTVVVTGSGREQRNVNWAEARGRWDVASGLKNQAQLDELIAFFRARNGRAYGFRFKDWTDYPVPAGQALPVRQRDRGPHDYPSRVVGAVRVYKGGVEQLSGWSVNVTTGLITFSTAPASGVQVTADFEFDLPVRFDTDQTSVTIETRSTLGSAWGISGPPIPKGKERSSQHLIQINAASCTLWTR